MRTLTRIVCILLAAGSLAALTGGCTRKAKAARHLERADKYFAAAQYPKAEIEYLNALHFEGTNSLAISRLGAIYYEQGRFRLAFAFLSKARQMTPNDLELRVKVATLNLAARKNKEAQEDIIFVLDKSPTNA